MSFLSPAYVRPRVVVSRRGRRGRRPGRGRGRRGRRIGENAAFDDAGASYSSSDDESLSGSYSSDEGSYSSDEEALAAEFELAAAPAAAAPAVAVRDGESVESFAFRIMTKHGMIGEADPDAHVSSKMIHTVSGEAEKTLPVACDDDADVIVLECVKVCPDDEEDEVECSESEESEESCEEGAEKDEESSCEESDDSGDESLDKTMVYDCWVQKGDETEKKDSAHPDDCDKYEDECDKKSHNKKSKKTKKAPASAKEVAEAAVEEAVAKAAEETPLAASMKLGKPFKHTSTSTFSAKDSAGNVSTQQLETTFSGMPSGNAYVIHVSMKPYVNGVPSAAASVSAKIAKVKLNAAGAFEARPIRSGVQSLRNQKTPPSAIAHAMSQLSEMI